jgi:monovalent cation/hydrogen antiporter
MSPAPTLDGTGVPAYLPSLSGASFMRGQPLPVAPPAQELAGPAVVLFVTILILLFAAVLLSRLAWSLSVPYPSLLALGGAALALLPGIPMIELEPSLALAIFVAPVLLDAAYDASLRDLRDNRLPIILLVVAAVGVTTVAVAVVFRAMVPDVPWPAAVALGAMVAPPDAAAAIAVLRQVSIPNRLLQILEGESLFNDASALLIFAVAVRLVEDGSATLAGLIPTYAASVVGSVIVGGALGLASPRLFRQIRDASAAIVLQFANTYGVWVLAEFLHLSPILTMVTYGITIARYTTPNFNPVMRLKSFAVWDTVVFLSNVLAFSLIGLQLGPLLAKLSPEQRMSYLMIGGVVLAVVIAARIAWVMSYNSALRFKNWRFGVNLPERMMRPTARGGIIIAWSGMRGIVSLAAALALPVGFPERDLIQFVAFVVVLGTLVIQGFTLGPLVKLLHVPDDREVEREVLFAKRRAFEAAIATLQDDDSVLAQALRDEYQAILDHTQQAKSGGVYRPSNHQTLRLTAIRAARETILTLRAQGEIGNLAFYRVQETLDRSDIYAMPRGTDG